ncbi:hypothetical protein LX36DRAFT_236436 [Colletotrichum falcatum]|nr:hypothetical protein LX36DRAFT_236436 [Colletotrichum falcatum]
MTRRTENRDNPSLLIAVCIFSAPVSSLSLSLGLGIPVAHFHHCCSWRTLLGAS